MAFTGPPKNFCLATPMQCFNTATCAAAPVLLNLNYVHGLNRLFELKTWDTQFIKEMVQE